MSNTLRQPSGTVFRKRWIVARETLLRWAREPKQTARLQTPI